MKEIYLFRDAQTKEVRCAFDKLIELKEFIKYFIKNLGYKTAEECFESGEEEIVVCKICTTFYDYMDNDERMFSERPMDIMKIVDENDDDFEDGSPEYDDMSGDETDEEEGIGRIRGCWEEEKESKPITDFTKEENEMFEVADAIENLEEE